MLLIDVETRLDMISVEWSGIGEIKGKEPPDCFCVVKMDGEEASRTNTTHGQIKFV